MRVGGQCTSVSLGTSQGPSTKLLDAGFARIVIDLRHLTFLNSAAVTR